VVEESKVERRERLEQPSSAVASGAAPGQGTVSIDLDL
jgi:hypothetical protein